MLVQYLEVIYACKYGARKMPDDIRHSKIKDLVDQRNDGFFKCRMKM